MAKKLAEVAAEKVVGLLHTDLDSGTAPAEKVEIDLVHDYVIDAVGDALRARRPKAVFEVNALLVEQMRDEGAFVPESRAREFAERLVDAAWGEE